jgi:hypothetical protein
VIIAKTVEPPPGKRVGQGGQVECDHPKRRGPLTPKWDLYQREGDVCDACGWREALPMRVFSEDGSSEEVNAVDFFRSVIAKERGDGS